MDRMRGSFIISLLMVWICLPTLSYSDVKVTLLNGREIIADACEEEGGQLVCTKMGGTFDIEKKDVANVREIRSGGYEPPPVEPATAPQTEQEKKTEGNQGDNRGDKENPPAGGQTGSDKRLEDIIQKKKELLSEREKLVKERQQLQEDLKKASDWMPTKQYEELNKRNTELAEKIKRFNEETGTLNDEEKQIIEGRKKKD